MGLEVAVAALADEIGGVAVRCDQADLGTLPAIIEPVRYGLDILVNNAAISFSKLITDLTPDDFDRVLAINTKFPLFAIQLSADEVLARARR